MELKDLLAIMQEIAEEHNLNTPYIVGGVPRNIVLGKLSSMKDIDITTGNKDVSKLAILFAKKLNTPLIEKGKHKSIKYRGVNFDFSTNFIYNNVDKMLLDAGRDPDQMSNLEKETFSRDFTINTLLLDLNLERILDITGFGEIDSKNKVLVCPLDCNVSFITDPKRILRVFKFKSKYGFTVPEDVLEAVRRNASLIKSIKPRRAAQMTNEILREDPSLIDDFIELGLMQHLPLTKYVTDLLLKDRKMLRVL